MRVLAGQIITSDSGGAREVPEEVEAVRRRAELMAGYCDGELAAFHALYAELAPRLLGYLVGMVGEKSAAEDLLQQTFMKVHQSRSAYLRGANPTPWIYTIAHRTCLDEIRRRKRAKVRVSSNGDVPLERPVGLDGSEEPRGASALSEQLIDRGLEALAGLPEAHREAVLMTKLQGRTIAQAAAIAGTSIGALKQRAHRGYVALRVALGHSNGVREQ